MKLFELFDSSSLPTKLAIAADQIKSSLNKGEDFSNWDVQKLLKYFEDYDIIIDVTTLYDLIQMPPLNGIINNIQGDKVIFKGYENPEQPEDEQKNIVNKMAYQALNK